MTTRADTTVAVFRIMLAPPEGKGASLQSAGSNP
jgi:hypothetical protein